MGKLDRRALRPCITFLLAVSLIGPGCVIRRPTNQPPANTFEQIQLSPPAEILASASPFLPLDPGASPDHTYTATEDPLPTATSTAWTPTNTSTPSVSRTMTGTTTTLTPTLLPTTQPIMGTHTVTPTASATPGFAPGYTGTASPTHTAQLPTVPPPPTASDTPVPTVPASCAPGGNSSFESALIGLINQERQNRGLGTLSTQSQLTTAARNHGADMACNSFFSHTGSDGSLPWDRVSALGYSYLAIAENIFAGSSNAQTAFTAWMNSPGHRDNMLNPTYTEIGIGYRFWADSPYGAYTTAVLANPR